MRIGVLFDNARVQVVEMFCSVPNKSVSDAFRFGSIDTQFHTDTEIDGTTLHFPECATSEKGGASTRCKELFDLGGYTDVTEIQIVLFTWDFLR